MIVSYNTEQSLICSNSNYISLLNFVSYILHKIRLCIIMTAKYDCYAVFTVVYLTESLTGKFERVYHYYAYDKSASLSFSNYTIFNTFMFITIYKP